MLEKKDAIALAVRSLSERAPPGEPWVLSEDQTIETRFAWIFFYNSKKYAQTANVSDRLAGNGPVFVNKKTGAVEFYGSTTPLESIIQSYEKAFG